MKKLPLLLLALCLVFTFLLRADEEADATLTKVGENAPSFTCTTLDGSEFDLAKLRGKVVVVDFFATWCGPCEMAMPHLEKDVWQKFKGENFALVAVAREQENKDIQPFREEHKLSFPMAADPKREAYAKYATGYIPRTYVIDAEGKIVFQSVGFSEEEFAKMAQIIETELAKQKGG